MAFKKRKREPMRCTAMKGKARCVMLYAHAGWHHDGAWLEWLADDERKAAFQQDPCQTTVVVDSQMVQCDLPAKHHTAHHGSGYIWTDPNPIPTPKKAWQDEEEDAGYPY